MSALPHRRIRVLLVATLLITLPLSGFLFSLPNEGLQVAALVLVAFACAIGIEVVVASLERELMRLQLHARQDAATLEIWREKVRELDRIVGLMSDENAEYRREALNRKLHESQAEGIGSNRVLFS